MKKMRRRALRARRDERGVTRNEFAGRPLADGTEAAAMVEKLKDDRSTNSLNLSTFQLFNLSTLQGGPPALRQGGESEVPRGAGTEACRDYAQELSGRSNTGHMGLDGAEWAG